MSRMEEHCFIRQEATTRILECVSRYCAECYREFGEGEEIFYDTQSYRYLCKACAEEQARHLDEACERIDEEVESGGLF
ncbi:hypothetical protein [Nitratifractor sp.]